MNSLTDINQHEWKLSKVGAAIIRNRNSRKIKSYFFYGINKSNVYNKVKAFASECIVGVMPMHVVHAG